MLQKKAQEKLAPSVKYSEGQAYDIVSYNPKDRVALQVVNNKKYKPGKRIFGEEGIEKIKSEREAEVRLQNQRKLNRISICRFQDPYKKPFNPVSNQPYYGEGAPPVFAPHINAPPTPLEKLRKVENECMTKTGYVQRPVKTAPTGIRTRGSRVGNSGLPPKAPETPESSVRHVDHESPVSRQSQRSLNSQDPPNDLQGASHVTPQSIRSSSSFRSRDS